MEILFIKRTFGDLKEIRESLINISEINDNFFAIKEKVKSWQNYGQHVEYTITIYLNKENQLISYNEYSFSPIIKDEYTSYLSYKNKYHKFIITGSNPKGVGFKKTFHCLGSEVLPHIIYSIILISELKDLNKTDLYWNLLTDFKKISKKYSPLKKLDLWYDLRNSLKSILYKYPFMASFFQNGLDEILMSIKEDINKDKFHSFNILDN